MFSMQLRCYMINFMAEFPMIICISKLSQLQFALIKNRREVLRYNCLIINSNQQIIAKSQLIQMSISEDQYYQGKIFLKNLADAHVALEQAAHQKAMVDKLKCYEKNLVSGVKGAQIKIKQGSVEPTPNFDGLKLKKVFLFTHDFMDKRLAGVQNVKTSSEMKSLLEKALA